MVIAAALTAKQDNDIVRKENYSAVFSTKVDAKNEFNRSLQIESNIYMIYISPLLSHIKIT